MSKYVIDLRPDCKVVQQICESDGQLYIGSKFVDYFEELNSDYINEHFSDLQDTAYQRGFENGKAIHEKGCEGCKYGGTPQGDSQCFNCSNYYKNNWTAKDDKIEVGDEVYCKGDDESDSGVVTWVGKDKICVMWQDGSAGENQKDEFLKTGRHFDIASILEDMRK